MKTNDNTVLITGGATGIGFAIAESFLKLGNEVIICGRREDRLREAKERLPALNIRKCDVSKESDRKKLFEWVSSSFSGINVLVNNAGIQRPIDLRKGIDALLKTEDEIEINLKAQIYFSAYFIPLFSKRKEAAIVNVSSGLGFVPLAMVPVYSATKAALHSFTMSLRHQLSRTPIKVFEVIPPMVHDTYLHGEKHLPKNEWSSSSAEVAAALMKGFRNDEYEISLGPSKGMIANWRSNPEQAFRNMNDD